jgi:SAM-dependent methyltransferase
MAQAPSGQEMKAAMKSIWMAGDFGKIAQLQPEWGENFIARLGLKPGMHVLDVGCGTGNQAIPAAKTGAHVIGVDIATNLLEQATARARQERLETTFVEGDAQELPFPNDHFDVVYSMFGAMFAPQPDRVAAELTRVCKPGGLIVMANWTPESLPGQLFRLSGKYAPPPPGIQPPSLWGVEQVVRERFGPGVDVATERRVEQMHADMPPAGVVELFCEWFGPVKMTCARLDPEALKSFKADMEQVWAHGNHNTRGGTERDAEFLEVRGRKR